MVEITKMEPILIEAALNGGRSRTEHPAVPVTPEEVATDALACRLAGASVVHIHAQNIEGDWLADAGWYAEACRAIREQVPDLLISITSIRPEGIDVAVVTELLETLSMDPATRPDLISINLGHITNWIPNSRGGRSTVHFPNSYEDISSLLAVCRRYGVVPELGIMDLGFVSNAEALRADGLLPENPWFLIELDNPVSGSGSQVAPSTPENYEFIAGQVGEQFPGAVWAAHGSGLAGYDVLSRAIDAGDHIRVGIEDAAHLPGSTQPATNPEQVAWAVRRAAEARRVAATPAEARSIIGMTDESSPSR